MTRAVLVHPAYTLADLSPYATPELTTLGDLVTRVATRFTGEGVLLLEWRSAAILGLPVFHDGHADQPPLVEHPAAESCRAAGWTFEALKNWTSFRAKDRPTVHLGVVPWIDPDGFPLWNIPVPATLPDTVARLALWHELVGRSYLMTPGVAALQVLRDCWPVPAHRVTWKSAVGPEDACDDRAYDPGVWSNIGDRKPRIGYDSNMAGLAAAISCEVAPWRLEHTGRRAFDRKLSGWWKVEVAPWNDPRMPHPAGPDAHYLQAHGKDAMVLWLTTPTVALLEDLAELGVYSGISWTALDSWTRIGRRLFRPWGERMRDAIFAARGQASQHPDSIQGDDAELVAGVLKQAAAREAIGLMNAGSASVQRSDWYHTAMATKRCNRWRAAWKAGKDYGIWPMWFDDDNVVYDLPVPHRVGDRLGQFTEKRFDGTS